MDNRPPNPESNNVRTFYQRPWLDRLTGHYTVAWENEGRVASIRVRNRLTDMEGNRPALASLMHVPATIKSYIESKRRTILKKPLPFLVYEAIEHLETLIQPGARVVELGGGNSTLWFLAKGAEVVTIEHSEEWAREIQKQASETLGPEALSRLTIHQAAGDEAIEVARNLPDSSFDVALVDCMNAHTWRLDGVESLAPKVRSKGTLCLDNSDHPNNWSAVSCLGKDTRLRFTGYAPMCPVVTQTSFWTLP